MKQVGGKHVHSLQKWCLLSMETYYSRIKHMVSCRKSRQTEASLKSALQGDEVERTQDLKYFVNAKEHEAVKWPVEVCSVSQQAW